jgi:large subunit ribosomal protein L25
MADFANMTATPREPRGKGGARAARREGLVPGIVYGSGEDSMAVAMNAKMISFEYNRGGFFSRLYELEVGDETMRVLPRDVQLHPVTDIPLHVDFLRLTADTRINVDVPVRFINEEESPGIKRGGVLNVVRHTIEFNCRADAIPESVTVDLTGIDIGGSVHISAIDLPDGVAPTITDRDFTVATVAAPTIITEDEETTDEDEEGLEGLEGEEGTEDGEGDGEGGEEKADDER